MSAIWYLYGHILKNRVRKALRKPSTYFYVLLFGLYMFLIPFAYGNMLAEWSLDNPESMAALFTVFAFWALPANLIAYAKRKGLLYRKSDVHFLFPSPVSGKTILLYAHVRNIFTNVLLNFLVSIFCVYMFKAPWWRMLLYFLFSVVIENLLEGCLVILCYGNEKLGEKGRKLLMWGAYLLIALLVLPGVIVYFTQGLSWGSVLAYLHSDGLQLVPLIGWYVAVLHMLFMGPTAVNVCCSILYLVLFGILLWAAMRMKCSGEYYEDAMKFADDYEELLEKRKQGSSQMRMGKKTRFGKAKVAYRGKGAKAIFYRQLLEYKKKRFFFFDVVTALCLGGTVLLGWLSAREEFGEMTPFVIPMVMAYLVFIFTALSGKWGTEVKSPYTFLIPDNAFAKLWYATAMQHLQALVNGAILTIPAGIIMGLSPLTMALTILLYVMLNACKLYILAVAEVIMGNVLGQTGKQLFQLFLMGVVLTVGIVAGVIGMLVGGINLAYLLMVLLLTAMTAICMTIASLCFYRMETVAG